MSDFPSREPVQSYRYAVDWLDARNPKQRGSGTKTAVLGATLAWLFQNDPEQGLKVCVNELGTDTDSIATMAGAILGPGNGEAIPGPVSGLDYVLLEADRMAALASDRHVGTFPYPDLLSWTSPKTASDCAGLGDGMPHLAGLGPSEPGLAEPGGEGAGQFVWQWIDLWFGQRMLVKRRLQPRELPPFQLVRPEFDYFNQQSWEMRSVGENGSPKPPVVAVDMHDDLEVIADQIIDSDFDPEMIGRSLLRLSESSAGVERAVALTAILARAWGRR
jgi:hypothetical protein